MGKFSLSIALPLLLPGLVLGLSTMGAPGSVGAPTHAPAATPGTSAAVASDSQPLLAYKQYTYYGERYRDPFVPLLGQATMLTDQPPSTSTLALKGIIRDVQGRMALLASGLNSYILKGGRLYDGRNKIVKGISGVIKQNSVVIVGADRAVREIKVKDTL